MKKLLLPLAGAILTFAFIACQHNPPSLINPQQAIGSVELTFDLSSKTAKAAFTPNRLGLQAVLTPQTAVSFANNQFNVVNSGGNNFLVAKFNVSNTSGGTLNDLTLVAFRDTNNRVNTAISGLQNFQGLSSTQLDSYALAVKPAHAMSNATTVQTSDADAQFFTESEVSALQTEASALLTGGKYLFPYGYVARATGSTTSRAITNGTNTGTLTVGVQLPNTNESTPTPTGVYRFSMTFLVFTTPVTTRVSESLEEQAASGADTRATSFTANQIAGVAGTLIPKTNDKLVNACRVRTAGTSASPTAFLVATAPSTAVASFDQCFASAGLRQFSLNAATESIKGMAIQSDGKIILVGNTTSATTASDFLVVRLNPDGSFDRTFGTNGKITFDVSGNNGNDQATAVVLQSDGKIVVGGSVGTLNATAEDFAVIRVNTDGSRDTTFGAAPSNRFVADGGSNRNDQLSGLALQTVSSVNYIIGVGITNNLTSNNNGVLFRLKVSDGTLDTAFGTSGFTVFSFAGSTSTLISGTLADNIRGVAVDTNQKIVVVGEEPDAAATNFRFGVIRFTSSGAWDIKAVTTLLGGSASGVLLNGAGTQAVVCASSKPTAAGLNDFLALRFNLPSTGTTDGTLDTTGFGNTTPKTGLSYLAPSVINGDGVRSCTTDSTGRIILAGFGRITAGGTSAADATLARLNADGTTDTTFDTDGILVIPQSSNADEAVAVKVTSAGKILAAGFQRNPVTTTDDDAFVVQINP